MGSLATVTAFERETVDGALAPECKVDRGGGDLATASCFSPLGDDAPPLPGDVAYLGDDAGTGTAQIIAYQDPTTPAPAAPGEKRIYSRSGPGVVAAEIWLRADGSILVTNAGGTLELAATGAARLANALGSIEVDVAGKVTFTTPLGTFGADSHVHGSPFGPTSPPIPGT